MFEELCARISEKMLRLSRGKLFCLPYSRSLLDFFEARGIAAAVLVVRVVVFGKLDSDIAWQQLPVDDFAKNAIEGPVPNGVLNFQVARSAGDSSTRSVTFRTLGYPHGTRNLGSYKDGKWNGHLVVIVDGVVIDLTIGQLNDHATHIRFSPPYLTLAAGADFVEGRSPLIAMRDNMLLHYTAFPEERTYEDSRSWSDAEYRGQLKDMGIEVAGAFEGEPDSHFHKCADDVERTTPWQPSSDVARVVPRSISVSQLPRSTLSAIITPVTPSTQPTPAIASKPQVGRNAPCPCGSGKKYKKCHGKGATR